MKLFFILISFLSAQLMLTSAPKVSRTTHNMTPLPENDSNLFTTWIQNSTKIARDRYDLVTLKKLTDEYCTWLKRAQTEKKATEEQDKKENEEFLIQQAQEEQRRSEYAIK